MSRRQKDTPIDLDAKDDVQLFSVDDVPPTDAPWGRFRKRVETMAVRIDGPFEVETSEGRLRCEDGWLAMDARGYPYPIAADEFALIYERVPEVDHGYDKPKGTGWKRTPGRCVACGSMQMASDEALLCAMCENQGVDADEIMQIKMGTHPDYLAESVHGITVDMLPFDEATQRYRLPDGSTAAPADVDQALRNWIESNVGQIEDGAIV